MSRKLTNSLEGEKFIEDYLTNKRISFVPRIRFSDCRFGYPLPFDFAIIDDNKIICLIEFDKPIEAWVDEETLKFAQLRDSIKDNYCAKNKIPLLRIRYDEDIEEKLNLFLYKLKGPRSQGKTGGALKLLTALLGKHNKVRDL